MALKEDEGTGESQPADDIRSALASAIATQDAATESEAPAKPNEAKPEPEGDTKPAGAKEAAAAEPEGDKKPEPEKKPESKEPEADKAAATSKEPPANWTAADKATFKALPEPAQQFLLKRHRDMEADYTKKTQAISDLKKEYEPVDAFFAPHKDAMKAKGFTPRTLIEAWGNVESELAASPERAVKIVQGLVTGYKIPVEKIAAALGIKASPASVPEIDPATGNPKPQAPEHQNGIQLPPELLERLSRVENFTQTEQQRRTQEAQARLRDAENSVMSQIEKFKSEADKDGTLLHPHFEDVEADMTALANAAIYAKQPVPPLAELYERAVWSNPSTREKVRTAETQAAEKKRTDEARAKTAAAKKAGASVTGAPGAGQAPSGRRTSDLSLREQLLEAADDSAA